MNKTQLIEQLKLTEENVNLLLSAAEIKADLADYSDEQLGQLKAIAALVESGKAKTYKAAVELSRSGKEDTKAKPTDTKGAKKLSDSQAADQALAVTEPGKDLARITDSASALAAMPVDARAAIEKAIEESAEKFALELPDATAEQIQQFKNDLRYKIGLEIFEKFQAALVKHMTTPEFKDSMAAAIAGKN